MWLVIVILTSCACETPELLQSRSLGQAAKQQIRGRRTSPRQPAGRASFAPVTSSTTHAAFTTTDAQLNPLMTFFAAHQTSSLCREAKTFAVRGAGYRAPYRVAESAKFGRQKKRSSRLPFPFHSVWLREVNTLGETWSAEEVESLLWEQNVQGRAHLQWL